MTRLGDVSESVTVPVNGYARSSLRIPLPGGEVISFWSLRVVRP
jgi:hypothetical protein